VIYPAEFIGVPNNGTITVNTYAVGNRWNLLGNPYPSALDIHSFLLDPANSHLDRTVKLWTHNTPIANNIYNASDYATYNFTGGVGTGTAAPGFNSNLPTRFLASGQGFVIDGVSNGMATFRNSHRVSGNNTNFFRLTQTNQLIESADAIELQEKNRFWLTMSNHHNVSKELLVGYIQQATNEFDSGYDGKFTASGYGLEFYSILNQEPFVIQGRQLPFDLNDTVAIGYQAVQAGSYSIQLNQYDGFFIQQSIFIEDKLTGVLHPLHEGPYTFVTEAGRFDQRFVIRYQNETLSVDVPEFNESYVVVFKQDERLSIHTLGASMQKVVLYDMSGRTLFQRQGELGREVVFDSLGIAQQALLIEITTTDRGVIYKKYIY
jgi:hypothetical protein